MDNDIVPILLKPRLRTTLRLPLRQRAAALVTALVGATSILAPVGAAAADDDAPPTAHWEGAVGLVLRHGPTYQGASDSRTRVVPGLFLRYGRFSITTTGGFVTRSSDEVTRGAAAELLRTEDYRVNLSLRVDGGRDNGNDPMLAGLDDRRATLRGRLGVTRKFGRGWQVSAGTTPDLLGRDGGTLVDLGIGYGWSMTPTLHASLGAGGTWGNRRYMQSYFGITPEESRRSGHPAYAPGSGLRDIGAGFGLRTTFGREWVSFASLGISQMQGPTVDSPLTRQRSLWSLTAGLARRF